MAAPKTKPIERTGRAAPPARPPIDRNEPDDLDLIGTPYHDQELDVTQGTAHMLAVSFLLPLLKSIAGTRGLVFGSDNLVRYIDHRTGRQKQFSPDFILARGDAPRRLIADDLLLVLEVVSTNDIRKERKDTITMRDLNEFNGVPEFVLFFPNADDERSLVWRRMEGARYRAIEPDESGFYESKTVPGLRMRALPRERWTDGMKLEVFLGAERLSDY